MFLSETRSPRFFRSKWQGASHSDVQTAANLAVSTDGGRTFGPNRYIGNGSANPRSPRYFDTIECGINNVSQIVVVLKTGFHALSESEDHSHGFRQFRSVLCSPASKVEGLTGLGSAQALYSPLTGVVHVAEAPAVERSGEGRSSSTSQLHGVFRHECLAP